MPIFYRRPGVYLEESLLVNPVDVAGTITVSAFVGVAPKGPPDTPMLISSWSDYVTIFGGFDLIQPPVHDPNDVSTENLPNMSFDNLAALKADSAVGDERYTGDAFTSGQYVLLEDNSKAHYLAPLSSNRAAAAPDTMYEADPDITASDSTNAAKLVPGTAEVQRLTPGTAGAAPTGGTFKLTVLGVDINAVPYNVSAAALKTLIDTAIPGNNITVGGGPANTAFITLTYTGYGDVPEVVVDDALLTPLGTADLVASTATPGVGEGFRANPQTAWTTGQNIWIGAYAFYWTGTAWAAGTAGGGTPKVNSGVWTSGAAPGTPAELPPKPPMALSYLPYQVYSFFQNGGRFTWIVRAVSSDPEIDGISATISVNGTVTGTPSNKAFDLTASSVGVWGNNLSYVLIKQSSTPAGEPPVKDIFAMQVLLRNAAGTDEVVETFSNMSIDGRVAGTRRVDAMINDPGSGSRYLRVKGLNPLQLTLSYSEGAVPLTGGVDPGLPDALTLEQSAKVLDKVEGPMNINICAYVDDASYLDTPFAPQHVVGATLDPRALFPDREDVFAFNDNAPPRTENQSSAAYQSLLISGPLVTGNNSYCASYAPWILIPHPVQVGSVIAVPPAGAVMGVCARIDATIGVHRAPAGIVAGIENAVGTQTKFTDTELGTLNSSNINIIRSIIGSGICIMGARTRKGYGADRYISARRVLINLKEQLRRSTQYAVFENNDERLWSSMRVTGRNVLRPMWEQGGLRGVTESQAFYVKCDEDLNTPSVIASGEVRMEIGVALEYPAEFVIIKLTQIAGTQFSNEIQVA